MATFESVFFIASISGSGTGELLDEVVLNIDDEAEVERLQELINDEGSYALEEDGEWYLDETEVWVWGPLEVSDDAGNTRIICADADGNMTDFKEE